MLLSGLSHGQAMGSDVNDTNFGASVSLPMENIVIPLFTL